MADSVRAVICLDDAGVWAADVAAFGIRVVPLHRRPGFSPLLGLHIARVARECGASILHCHHYSPFVYGRLAAAVAPRLRLVFTEHGRLSDAAPSMKRRLVNPWLARFRGSIHAVSFDLKQHMIDSGFPPDRIQVIHNGIDAGAAISDEQIAAARAALGATEGILALGTVARLDAVKDLETMLRAVAILHGRWPTMRLWVIGDGQERNRLETVAAQLGIAGVVRFAGHRDDVRHLLPGLDVYVNSSISEGISLTLLEAMAAERPVVATRVGGTPEVVEHEVTGLLAPSRQPEVLADAIDRLLSSGDFRRSLGTASRRRVERHFSLDRMVADYINVYRSVSA